MSINTLHKGDDDDDDDNNNNNIGVYCCDDIGVLGFDVSEIFTSNVYEDKKSFLRGVGVKWKLQPHTSLG